MPAQATLILSNSVNTTIEITKAHTMTKILFRDSDSSHLPQITGIIGSAQGARMVNAHAK